MALNKKKMTDDAKIENKAISMLNDNMNSIMMLSIMMMIPSFHRRSQEWRIPPGPFNFECVCDKREFWCCWMRFLWFYCWSWNSLFTFLIWLDFTQNANVGDVSAQKVFPVYAHQMFADDPQNSQKHAFLYFYYNTEPRKMESQCPEGCWIISKFFTPLLTLFSMLFLILIH